MKIAFDIDGTIGSQSSFNVNYSTCEPYIEMIKLVNDLYDAGHEIYFFTARHFRFFKTTDEFLKKSGFKYTGLIMNKPCYDLLVDDRAVKFDYKKKNESISEILKIIEDLNA